MIPGVDPRQLKQMMRQMGMSQEDIDTSEIIIKTRAGKLLIFDNPDVQKVTMKGQVTFQITGTPREESVKLKVSISEDDVKMVAEQAKVSLDVAKTELTRVNGDLAEAIVNLSTD